MDAELNVKEIEQRKELDYQAELGRSYAPEFISSIANQAVETLEAWLRANNAPSEVINLVDDVVVLERCARGLENGKLSDWDALSLIQELPLITERIARLGGSYCGGGSESFPRENVIIWQPEEHKD